MTNDIRNSLLTPSELFCGLPDFAAIDNSHVREAFSEAMRSHARGVDTIATSPEAPAFVNTIEAMEKAGQDLDHVAAYSFNVAGTDTTDIRMEIEAEIAPQFTAHLDQTRMRSDPWQRINAIDSVDDAANPDEVKPLLKRVREDFQHAGTDLSDEDKTELSRINSRLSELSTAFGESLLEDTAARAVEICDHEEFTGLSDGAIASFAAYAKKADADTPWLIPLNLPSTPVQLVDLDNPATRAKLYEASLGRAGAASGKFDNFNIMLEVARLCARRAKLLGYNTHAGYVIAKETATTAGAVWRLIAGLAPATIANAEGEYKRAADLADDETATGADWPYWERRRKAEEFAVDTEKLENYFELYRAIKDGVFYVARKLYGIEVIKRGDLQGYAPGTTVWGVRQGGGEIIGLIITDYFSRPTKRGGAWMSSFRDQSRLLGRLPAVVNVMNIAETEPGTPVLLTLDEVTTAFHELRHALHGLLSDVTYPIFPSTNVPRDFMEFPSQINENWALELSTLASYAVHVRTGEPIPAELAESVKKAHTVGGGFATVEYLAARAIDLAWHSLTEEEATRVIDVDAFEAEVPAKLGLDVPHLAPRYCSRYFNHIFAGGYLAGYYSYLRVEVFDANGSGWFTDNGGATISDGSHFREEILSRGGAIDFMAAYRAFRGRDKDTQPLLERRGLSGTDA